MSGQIKRIAFGAEDTGVLSFIDKLRRSAQDLSKGMIADALKYSSSAKEQNKYLQDQINLLTQRNKLDMEGRRLGMDQSYKTAISSAKSSLEKKDITGQYKQQLSALQSESSTDSLQIKYLKEIVDAIKMSAKEELKEESRQSNNTNSFFSRIFGSSSKEGSDPEDDYKKSQKGDANADKKDSEKRDRNRGRATSAFNTATGIATQGNELAMAAAAFAIIPMVGQGISTIANKIISEGSRLQEGRLTLGRLNGNPNVNVGKSAAGMGVDQAEFMTFAAQMAKNRGYSTEAYALGMGGFSDRVEGAALRLQGTKQMYGVSDSSLLGFDKLQRLDNNKRDTAGDVQNLIKILRDEGAFGKSGKDMASLEEFMHIQTNIMQDQSKRLESVNTNSNASVIASFQRLGGTFANPLTAGERIGTMNNAVVNPGNDFKQAMVYSSLRKLNPNADLFDLKKKQEEGIFGEGTLSQVMKDMTNRGGSQGNKKIMLMEMFGLSANQTETLFNSYQEGMKGGKDPFADIASRNNLFKKSGLITDEQFVAGGTNMSGSIDRLTAKMTNRIAPTGEALVNKGEEYINKIEKDGLMSGVGTIAKDIGKEMANAFKGALISVSKDVKESFSVMTEGVKSDWKNVFNLFSGPGGIAKIIADGVISKTIQENPTYVPKKGN